LTLLRMVLRVLLVALTALCIRWKDVLRQPALQVWLSRSL